VAGSAQCISITKNADGTVRVQWDGGEAMTFSTFDELKEYAFRNGDSREKAQQYLLAWWLNRSADGSNENLIEGKTLTFDLAAANPIRVQ
jgi:hypothetical protein